MATPIETDAKQALIEFAQRIACNARQLANDPEQSASSRRTWAICADDADATLESVAA